MLKAKNISFYKIFSARYISAETLVALKPQKVFSDLKFEDCIKYPNPIQAELLCLFNNYKVKESIDFLETLEAEMNVSDAPITLLNSLMTNASYYVIDLINKVGERVFLLEYVGASSYNFSDRLFINNDNESVIKSFIQKYKDAYTEHIDIEVNEAELIRENRELHRYDLEEWEDVEIGNMVNESEYSISSCGESAIEKIDNNSQMSTKLTLNTLKHYLVSLSDEEFYFFEEKLKNTLSSLSIRTRNIVKLLGYKKFYVNYLLERAEKLLDIRNCGKKSIAEIISVRDELIDFVSEKYNSAQLPIKKEIEEEIQLTETESSKTLKDVIGAVKYASVLNKFDELRMGLSVRSQNCIKSYKSDFIEDFVKKNKNLRSIRNLGEKSEEEIKGVIDELTAYIEEIKLKSLSPEDVYLEEKASVLGDCLDSFSRDFYKQQGHLPMFHIIENFFKIECTNELTQIYILNLFMPLFDGENHQKSLEEIATLVKLTRERVRQICDKVVREMHAIEIPEKSEKLNYSKLLSLDEWKYFIDDVSGQSIINDLIVTNYKTSEQCSLKANVLILVISLLLRKDFEIIGEDPFRFTANRQKKSKWEKTYLINRKYTSIFDFDLFRDLVLDYEENLVEDVNRDIKDILQVDFLDAWKSLELSIDLDSSMENIISTILIEEFGKIVDENMCFTFEGRKELKVSDVMYNLLQENGEPLSLDYLYEAITSITSRKYKNTQSLKNIINNDPRICLIGNNNLVGLLEWSHLKIGSIRSIIAEFLDKYDVPQPLYKIVNHVQQFRDTSENSVRSTMGSSDTFVQFKGGRFGLSSKQYDESFLQNDAERFFSERVIELESFLKEQKHFPFGHSDDPQEERLYQWLYKTKNSETVSLEHKNIIQEILDKYKMLPTTKKGVEWQNNYDEYYNFVSKRHRKPSKFVMEERKLAEWFIEAKFCFNEGNLLPTQEKAFIELCNIL